jgi:hypothetical protein
MVVERRLFFFSGAQMVKKGPRIRRRYIFLSHSYLGRFLGISYCRVYPFTGIQADIGIMLLLLLVDFPASFTSSQRVPTVLARGGSAAGPALSVDLCYDYEWS